MPAPIPKSKLFDKLAPEKKAKVYRAALDEFAAHGYRNASMNQLVKSAGISKGSLFQYFKTKRALFDVVVENAVDLVKAYLRRVRNDTFHAPVLKRMEKLIRSGFKFIDEHPLLARIYFHLLLSGEAPFSTEKISLLRMQSVQFIADILSTARDRGELRESIDIEKTAFLINSLLETLLRSYYTEFLASGMGLYHGNSEQIDEWIAATLSLLKSGMTSPNDGEDNAI